MNGGAVLAYVWFALMSSGNIPISKGIGAYHIYRKYEMNWSLVTWITLLIKKKNNFSNAILGNFVWRMSPLVE